MTDTKLIVLSNPVEGQDSAYNLWYDDTHLPEVLAVPGMAAAQRFSLAEGKAWRYAAIYEIDAEAPQPVIDELLARVADGRIAMSDAFDTSTFAMLVATPLGERRIA